jgi:hypothetical protein
LKSMINQPVKVTVSKGKKEEKEIDNS